MRLGGRALADAKPADDDGDARGVGLAGQRLRRLGEGVRRAHAVGGDFRDGAVGRHFDELLVDRRRRWRVGGRRGVRRRVGRRDGHVLVRPVLPSMMVMVLVAVPAAGLCPGGLCAGAESSGLTATAFGAGCPSAGFAATAGCELIGATAIGSPPNGLFPAIAQATNTPRNSAKTPAITCEVVIGIANRRRFDGSGRAAR